jgi:hypothetical protein
VTKGTQNAMSLITEVWKLWNKHSKILVIEGFPMIPRAGHDIPKMFHFDFTEFSMTKLFNVK